MSDIVFPDFENVIAGEIPPMASFIKDRLRSSYLSLITAEETAERDQQLAAMTMCGAALALLVISYLSEKTDLLVGAKELVRTLKPS